MLGLAGESLNLTEYNLEKMKELFPEVFEEGKIDFDKLRLILGDEVEDNKERYEFTWHGKSNAIRIAQTPSTGTLIPDKESSKNWDDTENLYIEGDNLEVLKLLQKSYFGKVKMIYIDPPYNTGNDFVYHDDFRDNITNYKAITNQTTKANYETNGRYHTYWLNMMYSRLKVSRNLLTDDGVIFISIDDNEVFNIRKVCDEIFGEENFIATFIRQTASGPKTSRPNIDRHHEYLICYAKYIKNIWFNGDPRKFENYSNPDNDINGDWTKDSILIKIDKGRTAVNAKYPIHNPYLNITHYPPIEKNKQWHYTKPKFDELLKKGQVVFYKNKNEYKGEYSFYIKKYKSDLKTTMENVSTIFPIKNNYTNALGTNELKCLFENKVFDSPKPSSFIKKLIQYSTNEDSLVLDFFSGSSTTADAIIKMNLEDKGSRKFILVQIPELVDNDSDAYKSGYKNICEIGKERIRRAGDKIVSENKDKEGIENLDIGFKVFKLDSSNLKSWDSSIDNLEQNLLDMESNLKKDRTNEDLLYEILLKSGVELTAKIEEIKVGYNTLYNIGQGALLACLDDKITQDVIDEIPKHRSPFMDTKVIFKEAGFMSDAAKINAVQNLKQFKIEDVRSV
ncbi:site-specific DNA-methyltransferase [Intestinibacter bartlettii]|uniref:site-specific DNA-methyltransferase n=1 Tax=Intestinibacter bartlettii TaxID=261299 RepID=UPI003AB422D6